MWLVCFCLPARYCNGYRYGVTVVVVCITINTAAITFTIALTDCSNTTIISNLTTKWKR